MCILGAHTAQGLLSFTPTWIHTRLERTHGALWSRGWMCVVSALLPTARPEQQLNFLAVTVRIFFKFFFSRSSARSRFPAVETSYLTASRAVLFSRPLRVYTRSVHSPDPSFDLRHRDTVLCDQESHRDFPSSHIELPSALFFFCKSAALPHTVVRSAATGTWTSKRILKVVIQ